MEPDIQKIILNIISILQKFLVLGVSIMFIYLGILFYRNKYDEVKKYILWVIGGMILLFLAYTIPVLVFSFLKK